MKPRQWMIYERRIQNDAPVVSCCGVSEAQRRQTAAEAPLQLLFLEVMYKKMRQKQGEALQFINLLAKASCDPPGPRMNDAGGPSDLEQQKKKGEVVDILVPI